MEAKGSGIASAEGQSDGYSQLTWKYLIGTSWLFGHNYLIIMQMKPASVRVHGFA